MDRLKLINNDFSYILEISAKCGYLTGLLKDAYQNADITATDMSPLLLDSFNHDRKLLIDDEDLEFSPNSFDLTVYSLGLHWINDVQRFLSNIRTFLKPEGIFIGNFVGGDSLKNLRKVLIEAEITSNFKHSPHISPFIHFDHVPILFSQAGFAEVIVDYENISLEFDNPLALMREIKNIGESNSLNLHHNYAISKKILSLLQNYTNTFEDNINLISFIASPNKNSIRLKLL
ncbi:MAG: methyltransferase domain-containing protein [Rickettsia endosymbiont of Ixodes persulcatus]|nr:methyltransferase domain-containing protein [Rickettsia endosymbiont of Ixodes persulcatus]MCZ6901892.1 methyltransferase domain-containing protein [Rickettsia endosymbiont of Ixodes persulcatus]MCZ6903460.1 methyltransferase domain-containing protein [Rickettsia endosymbiont of Ixodes persulcatus]MCZ6909498.1 methyltransferase domain-containing protein [Rickettsia endosymbiont of Ixodes persulcatus]MCZ6909720.1 methyltransferase domain-containing protein [Rickettsia endosymbiont of Ixodes p